MHITHLLKTIGSLLIIFIVFGAIMFGLNFYTAPLIENNNKGAEFAPLLAVMPEADNFEVVTSTLKDVPSSVIAVYKETSGKGFVVRVQASTSYSKEPMEITFGVDASGKICGIQLDKYTDSIDFRAKDENYIPSYVGKDSALADIGTVSGATFSSTAFKTAVTEGFSLLISNNLIKEGVKSDAQILSEMIPTLAPGYVKTIEMTASGNIEKALKAENDAGFALIMKSGEASYLALVNAMGSCKIYNVEGTDVTADQTVLAEEAVAFAVANPSTHLNALKDKIAKMMEGATEITELKLDTFNTVVAAVSFKVDGADYYAFYSRSIGFHQMDVYFVIDANGAIAKIDAKQFIFEEEYFSSFGGMSVPEYKDGFVGITNDTWNGDAAIIATATMTSNAMKQSTTDAFECFHAMKGGE